MSQQTQFDEDYNDLLNDYDPEIAFIGACELEHFWKHGALPANAEVIAEVVESNNGGWIIVHTGNYIAKSPGDHHDAR